MAKSLSPIETFLAPLAKLVARHPDLEAEVIWQDADGWQAQGDAETLLDAEEIPFYCEGLLLEGFAMQWQALAEADSPKEPVHIRLFFWQGIAAPPPPEDGLILLTNASWTA
jgi:hypothetical protein